eukprot:9613245-Alexandrium_andersonii.AAC.1
MHGLGSSERGSSQPFRAKIVASFALCWACSLLVCRGPSAAWETADKNGERVWGSHTTSNSSG